MGAESDEADTTGKRLKGVRCEKRSEQRVMRRYSVLGIFINLAGNVIKTKRILYISMMIIAFVATYLLDVSAMIIILACLGIGLLDLAVGTFRKKNGGIA